MDVRTRRLVEILWNYHHLHHEVTTADAVLVLGSHDVSVARRGAELMLEGRAPLLICSGGLGSITRTLCQEAEADQFARIAIDMGVPAASILVENQSTNTGDNIVFTRRLLAERGLDPRRFIVVQKPYMERRTYATFRQRWPEKDVTVTSPLVAMDEYLARYSNGALSVDQVIGIMVGDLQRIREYPKRGFQIAQEIPDGVWAAYEELVGLGYNTHLICPATPDALLPTSSASRKATSS